MTAKPSIQLGDKQHRWELRPGLLLCTVLACILSENWPQPEENKVKSILNYYRKPSSGHNPRFQVPQLESSRFFLMCMVTGVFHLNYTELIFWRIGICLWTNYDLQKLIICLLHVPAGRRNYYSIWLTNDRFQPGNLPSLLANLENFLIVILLTASLFW